MIKSALRLLPVLLVLTLTAFHTGIVNAASVPPIFVDGNPDCQSQGYTFEYKVDPPSAGPHVIPNSGNRTVTLTLYKDGNETKSFDWTSTLGMNAVLVKAGSGANKYVYVPASFGDTNLVGPENKGISHISFCYNSVPTATYLGTVSGIRRPAAIKLKWQTVSELRVVGMNVWRSPRKGGTFERLNPALLPAKHPGAMSGASYRFKDKTALAEHKYFYKIELVGTSGTLEWSDPVGVPRATQP
jgi:hypothetical protein